MNVQDKQSWTTCYQMNQKAWDKMTMSHLKSDFYDVEEFLAGKSSLQSIELEQMGDVRGKDLLHLQCHW